VNKIPIIEDAAHALGATWRNIPIGSIGTFGCFSFQSYKMINGGEGGMLVSNDSKLMAKATIMSGAYESNWGNHMGETADLQYWASRLPLYNMRMNNPTGVIVGAQLPYLSEIVEQMRFKHALIKNILNNTLFIFDLFII
jgi:dTDP-4-amino-4,6-dideoxygalactose transaminase